MYTSEQGGVITNRLMDCYIQYLPCICFSELISCHPVTMDGNEVVGAKAATTTSGNKSKRLHNYIELCLTVTSKSMTTTTQEAIKKPKVRCQSEEMAQSASRHVRLRLYLLFNLKKNSKLYLQINYAKGIFDEREQTLNSSETVIKL